MRRLMLRNDSLLSDILCCDVEAIIISPCVLRDENTATTIISWNMLDGTLEGVDSGSLLKTIITCFSVIATTDDCMTNYAFSLWIVLQRRLSMKWKAKRRLLLLAFAEWRNSVAAILLRVSNRKELALKWVTFIVPSVTPMSNNWSCDLRVSAVKESQWLFFVRHLETGGGIVTTIIEWFWIREINDDDNQTKSVTWLDGIESIRWILWVSEPITNK